MAGFLTGKRIWGCTTFVATISNYIYAHLMKDFTIFKHYWQSWHLKNYVPELAVSLNMIKMIMVNFLTKNSLLPAIIISTKPLSFVELAHTIKNGIIENRNKQLTQTARVLLLHGMRIWPQMVDQMFWPFAI
jgi:hypothetical protein